MIRALLLFTLVVAVHAATVGTCENGECTTKLLTARYECTSASKCIQLQLAPSSQPAKYITITYQIPAFRDGETWTEFERPSHSSMLAESNFDAEKAYFQLAAPLITNSKTVGYLGVMQGIAFKEFQVADLAVPKIGSVALKPCMYKMEGGTCVPKTYKESEYKFSFMIYQTEEGSNPSTASFVLRATIDTSLVGDALVTFNGDSTLTLATPPGRSVAIKSISIGSFSFVFPTGVNRNNDAFVDDGCTVYVETVADKTIHLAFKVQAPGKNKFLIYDPTVDVNPLFSASSANVPVFIIAFIGLFMFI